VRNNGQGQATLSAPTTATTLGLGPAPRRRRPLRTRLASGHLLMVFAGLLTFVLVANALRSRNATVEVLVASADVAAGALVQPANTRPVELAASSSLRSSIVTPQELREGRWVATRRIVADEPVLRSALARPAGPNGQRAMSLPLPAEHAAGGAIQVGDRVDVINADGPQAVYVVRNAEVIGRSAPKGTSGLTSSSSGQFYVTIAVDAEPALRLASAIRAGKLEVVLSTGADQTSVAAPSTPGATRPGR
jgi:Flp pilus assembly protein CpaB